MKKKISLIIHGHFYQPPRENPLTGRFDKDTGCEPYHDWNEKIHLECYRPNTASRVLNSEGKIKKIVNNFEYLSFNFGPTLLEWMKKYDPTTLSRIINADKEVAKKTGGHGNALAQVYNHVIMPLAKIEDQKLQIEWGIRHFKNTYDREPDGIWLAETAINSTTLDLLINYNFKYVILSPYQAEKFRKIGEGRWHEVTDIIDSSKPYLLRSDSGKSITGFFYNRKLSQGISFEHYLRSADILKGKIIEEACFFHGDHPLIIIATDGEIYGHHEPFGDMCLAAFFTDKLQNSNIEISNFYSYLLSHPVEHEAVLKTGEDNEGTSWSCSHGVKRWKADCGCSTGGKAGWNQKWRKPLREAYNSLRENFYRKQYEKLKEISDCPEELLSNYVNIFTSESPDYERHLTPYLKETNGVKLTEYLAILESLKFIQFTFTSCAWFFSDLAGIEIRQSFKYAAMALLLQNYTEKELPENFLTSMKEAVTNEEKVTGDTLFLKNFKELEKNAGILTATFAITHALNPSKLKELFSPDLDLYIESYKNEITKDSMYLNYFIKLTHRKILTEETFNVEVIINSKKFTPDFIVTNEKEKTIKFSLADFPEEERDFVEKLFFSYYLRPIINDLFKFQNNLFELSQFNFTTLSINEFFKVIQDLKIEHLIAEGLDMETILSLILKYNLFEKNSNLTKKFQKLFNNYLSEIVPFGMHEQPENLKALEMIEKLLDNVKPLEMHELQNHFYSYILHFSKNIDKNNLDYSYVNKLFLIWQKLNFDPALFNSLIY